MYAVTWMEIALDALADAFVAADLPDREAIERAVERLNRHLAADPYDVGESRTPPARIAFEKPCAISFVVDDPPGDVRVTHFWLY